MFKFHVGRVNKLTCSSGMCVSILGEIVLWLLSVERWLGAGMEDAARMKLGSLTQLVNLKVNK